MRQPDGLYIGNNWCVYWKGIKEVVEGTCCGGRKYKKALTDCEKRGVVEAERTCNASCPFKKQKI